MCGIAGWISGAPVDRRTLEKMRDALSHRGPDGAGLWISPDGRAGLAHRRLSIIDLSAAGTQPFHLDNDRYAFVHNGEIYNYRQLRQQSGVPETEYFSHTDSEVAFRSLIAGGESAVSTWEGMFAAAFWDDREQTLILARDRFGIKPLYWARRGEDLLFASELKALLVHPKVSRELDVESVGDFFSYGYVPFDRSIMAGVSKVAPGHVLISRRGTETVRPYWSLGRKEVSASPEQFRARLEDAVLSHTVSDVPVGTFLSGGLDSGSVTAIVVEHSPHPVETFTLAYRGGGQEDVRYADLCARRWQTRHHEMTPEMHSPAEALEIAADYFDEPIYDSTSLAVFDLSRETRRFVKVVLSGDGGDEAFGGYGWHRSYMNYEKTRRRMGPLAPAAGVVNSLLVKPLSRLARGNRLEGAGKVLSADPVERYFLIRGLMNQKEREMLLVRPPQGDPAWLWRRFYRPELPLAHRLLYLDLMTYLPDNNLALVDRASMASSLEVRVPLLDRSLVEYAFSLPEESLVQPDATKILFRQAIADLLPADLLARPKYGFSPPFKHWLRGKNTESVLRELDGGRLVRDGVIRPGVLRRIVEHGHARRYNKLWAARVFETWYRRWV